MYSKNLQRFAWNIVYILVLGIIIYLGFKYQDILNKSMAFESSINPFTYLVYQTLFPVFIGLLIRLPSFIPILKKTGSWKIDWFTFIPTIVPTFYVTISKIGYFTPLGFCFRIATIHNFDYFHMVISIIFGYLLLSSFKKDTSF